MSATASSVTALPFGNVEHPREVREWRPLSPSCSISTSDAASTTLCTCKKFKSKDELFQAWIAHDVPAQSDRLMQEFLSGKDIRDGLTKSGVAYLTRLLSPTPIGNMRMLANRPEGSDMAKTFYEKTLRPAWLRLSERMQLLMDEGLLKRADPWVATMHWKGLNEWDMLDKRLLGITKGADPAEIMKAATAAADAFLLIYGNGSRKQRAVGGHAR